MLRRSTILAAIAALIAGTLNDARADEHPLLLFGGPNRDHFLGCLNCDPSEVFSIWNEAGEYGSPSAPDCIWNRSGAYGAPASELSPWNRASANPPFVVDRVGNFYGYFTRNFGFPDGVMHRRTQRRTQGGMEMRVYEFLAWFLEDYDLIIANLDHVRSNR